jgi:hypothetical protein
MIGLPPALSGQPPRSCLRQSHMTLTQILLAELILKGTVGTLLVLFPITTARVFGLPHGSVGIWARIAGVLLIGIAAAIWVENDVPDIRGLGLGGLIAINAVGLVGLVAFAVAQNPRTTRGTLALWGTAGLLFALCIFQIANL